MIDYTNETTLPFNVDVLTDIHAILSSHNVELLLLEAHEVQAINLETRNTDKPTDVLSFPVESFPGNTTLGTIVICTTIVQEAAKTYQHRHEDEIKLLFIHGMLHLLGYDHETDKGEMRDKEIQLIHDFKLPTSLIIRSER